ncbi:sigma-54-dependent Fis family transcriptional regulator [Nocardioides sp. DS6]|uniref:Sigma-54-dependent Fis family transcriptional regulator n=1 Tax=Nocardioides eburneus TaxID=3231482 RepID=A0ABV3T2C8_9ACTN
MPIPAPPSVAARFEPAYRRLVAHARALFLDRPSQEAELGVVRPEIVHSWHRSRSSAVDPVGGTLPVLELERGRAAHLVTAARPVLDRFTEQARDTEVWAMLLDREGVQVCPVAGDSPIVRESERRGCAPGAVYQECTVGTNGAGLSLERLESFVVVGDEHFRESEHNLVSAGVPLRDGLGRIAGTLLLCHRVGTASPLLLPYAEGLGTAITERIAAATDHHDRRLFEAYLRRARRPSLPVVALSERVFIANAAAQRLLRDAKDVDLLRATTLGGERDATLDLAGARFRVHCRAVPLADERAGVIASLTRLPSTVDAPGRATQAAPDVLRERAVRRARSRGLGTVVVGEPGSGRAHLVRATGDVAVLDGGGAQVAPSDWVAQLAGVVRRGPVLVRDVDALDPTILRAALGILRDAPHWVAATARVLPDAGVDVFPAVVACPPLRERTAELPDLVAALLADLGAGDMRVAPEVMSLFAAHQWLGNVSQLRRVLATAATLAGTGELRVEHLPGDIAVTTRSRLMGELEKAERAVVYEALRNARWNRDRAALALGISRATLYRRIRQFGLQVPGSR